MTLLALFFALFSIVIKVLFIVEANIGKPMIIRFMTSIEFEEKAMMIEMGGQPIHMHMCI